MSEEINTYKVKSREDFVKFLSLLQKDFLQNPENWENNRLDTFLEALSAYADEIQGVYDNASENVNADKPSWQTFADIFKGAMIYE